MKKLSFVKMVGAGNDFVVIDFRRSSFAIRDPLSNLARFLCERRTGVGADGLLVLEKSKKADFRMRIFNADGSEAEMCGNGLRCTVWYTWAHQPTRVPEHQKKLKVETVAGIYEAALAGKNRVKIKMEGPKDLKLNIPITVNDRKIKINYIDAGVPHAVVFVQGLDGIDIESIGRSIRYHEKFKPRGTNVDFVEFLDDKNIKMRAYERGVEGETLACGTGAVASAIITCQVSGVRCYGINVHTRGGILRVSFRNIKGKIKDVFLEGEAREVYKGEVMYV